MARPRHGKQQNEILRNRKFTSNTVSTEQNSPDFLGYAGPVTPRHSKALNLTPSKETTSVQSSEVAAAPIDSQYSPPQTNEPLSPSDSTDHGKLTRLLNGPNKTLYKDVWDAFCNVDQVIQDNLRAAVVTYLARSPGVVDIGRALTLLRQIPTEQWTDSLQADGIILQMAAGNHSAAVDMLQSGLSSRASDAGVEHLLEDAVMHGKWTTLLKVWLASYSRATASRLTKPQHSVISTATFAEQRLTKLRFTFERHPSSPDLAQRYSEFEHYLHSEAIGSVRAMNLHSHTRSGLLALRRWMADQVLRQPCSPKQAAAILESWHDHDLYQRYMHRMLNRASKGLETRTGLAFLTDIYLNYRKIGGARMRTPIALLRKLFNFCYPLDTRGLAEIYRDWNDSWGGLDRWGFEKFLKYYATSGDVQAVKDLWTRYIETFPDARKTPQGFRSLLNVYAEIGDTAGIEKEMFAMTHHHGLQPQLETWNILLKCYTRAGDEARAVRCFEDIRKVAKPDSVTYAHIMTLAAKRGDLSTVLRYFHQSQEHNVPVSNAMALSLVTVYCNNGRLLDAERISEELPQRGTTDIALWNQLILHNGMRGRLVKCYSLLKTMTDRGLEFDEQTHEFFLRALVGAGQTHAAYRYIMGALREASFPVRSEHFAIVMIGALRMRQITLAETVMSILVSSGLAVPFKAHVAMVEATMRRSISSMKTRKLAGDLVQHLRAMLPATTAAISNSNTDNLPAWTSPKSLAVVKKQTPYIGRAITLLVRMRDFTSVVELVDAYTNAFPEFKENDYLPPDIAAALMEGHLQDSDLDGVHRLWKKTVAGVVANGTNSAGKAYPSYQYVLARPLDVIVKALEESKDGHGLVQTVERLVNCGFHLTRKNWNLVIRALAGTGHWEHAMSWCEQMLMPRWRGWKPPRRSAQERREMASPRVLTASRSTVFSLQREWLKLRKLAAWSGEISSKLQEIERQYPMLHRAFVTTDYEHLPGTWVLPRKKSMNKAIKDMLKSLSRDELKAMKRALEMQLRRVKRQRWSRREASNPFRVAARRGKTQHITTRPAADSDLKSLGVMLRKELAA